MELSLHENLQRAIQELGWKTFTHVQQAAIPLAMEGKDLRVTARTGSGKTAAFLLPLLHDLVLDPDPKAGTLALILLPTRELARQTISQINALGKYGHIQAELITGGEDFKVQAARIRRNPHIIVGTPGRLLEHNEANNLFLEDVRWLVLDEADRMLDMGMGDDALALAQLCPKEVQTLLFSATTGGPALNRMVSQVLHEPVELMLDEVRGLDTHS